MAMGSGCRCAGCAGPPACWSPALKLATPSSWPPHLQVSAKHNKFKKAIRSVCRGSPFEARLAGTLVCIARGGVPPQPVHAALP